MNELEKLLDRYKIEFDHNDLITALTHNSFSKKNNSRYVFLGQFQFRGFVAQWASDNIAGSGAQLQHFLGNVFGQSKMESYFDKWKISKTRQKENIDIQTQKHIFVYAFLGFVIDNATKKQLINFAFDQFIATKSFA